MAELPDDIRAHLALALVPGLGPKTTAALLAAFGSPAAALTATAAQLRALPHVGDKTAAALVAGLRAVDVRPELERMARFGVTAVPVGFPGYPPPLARVPNPPGLLYVRGGWTDADLNAVGVVGSRGCTAYGRRMTELLCRGLARAGVTVVSGLARGIDAVAHRAALEAGGRTIAAVAIGLSATYPPEHAGLADEVAARGAVLTETPMGQVAPEAGLFPARNRIISGLSRGVVVVEADVKSGALITARHALEQGREVFAVPGPADSPTSAGCLELIRHGARLVRSADDILDDLRGLSTADDRPKASGGRQPPVAKPTLFDRVPEQGADAPRSPEPPPPPPLPELTPAERRVWDALTARRQGDELARQTGLPVGELVVALMQLEVKRLVRKLPGNAYERR